MMILQNRFPKRLIKVDPSRLKARPYLQPSDDCYFLGEYASRESYRYSCTNRLILNFKKPLNRQGRNDWRYKEEAIDNAAQMFRRAIKTEALDRTTFVPIPSSKCKDDPHYDDRLLRMLKLIRRNPPLDIRELLRQSHSVEADHESDNRKSPEELRELWEVDRLLTKDAPLGKCLAIVDDLLTTGAHFRAAESLLSCFNVKIVGYFLALGIKAQSSPNLL